MILTEEIFQETYIVRRLKMKESVKSFDCGDTDLNDFILNESLLYRKALLAVSYVVEDKKDNNRAAAYCRLGVDRLVKGTGMGSFLLAFIQSYFVINNKTGCRFLTVDAYSEAVPFYIKNGFVPLTPEDENSSTRLLFFDLNDIVDDEVSEG